MGLRQKLNESKPLSVGLALVLVVLAGGFIYWEFKPTPLMDLSKQWYTTDEGKTWFVDTVYKNVPFDHDGKPAYIAAMYKTEKGTIWCQYLARYTADSQKKLQAALDQAAKDGTPPASVALFHDSSLQLEVRKPNTTEWVNEADFINGAKIMGVTSSPDGSPWDNLHP